MKITIVTTVRNCADLVRDAMESVRRQILPDGVELEHVVVDGASDRDDTVEVIRKFAAEAGSVGNGRYSFKWVSEPDKGLYDGFNKGILMASGDVVGICNADDVLADDGVVGRIARAFQEGEIDATYADIRFVKREVNGVDAMRTAQVRRYCAGNRFRPWMFRFGTQVAHPSFFCRKECFERYGMYSMDYNMYADFELLLRFLWKYRIRTRYLPFCTHVMRLDGASTGSIGKTLMINRADLKALKDNGCWSNMVFLYSRYLFKIWGFVFRKKSR